MVDDVKDILETEENKGSADAVERARLARERREAEQRRRLDELRAHAAAAQAQREKRDEERRRRQEEQRSKDTDRRQQVEERKRAIWEASISRREALLQREKDREERLERARQARSTPRSAFAFGSSTPRLLEPADTSGFFWAARSTNPIDQMNFFDSLASSTSNVMYASAPLTRRASALQLDMCDSDNKDEIDRPAPVMWNSVARRRTDLVPTLPASRAPEGRSGDSTPGSRPGSAMSVSTPGPVPGVVRRPHSARRPRPASIAGTGVNTPRGGPEGGASLSTTPSVSRDASSTNMRPASTPRRVRPVSVHLTPSTPTTHRQALTPGEGKPPIQRKPKLSKEHEKSPRNIALKARSVSPGRTSNTPSPHQSKDPSVDKDIVHKKSSLAKDKAQVNATEVTQKLEALKIHNNQDETVDDKNNKEDLVKVNEKVQPVVNNTIAEESLVDINNGENQLKSERTAEVVRKEEKVDVKEKKEENKEKKEEVKEKKDDNKEKVTEKLEENEMTASMTARRITTEEEAKAALAERRRKAREELERQAELERQRLEREAERQAQQQKEEEERQRREEDEARELAALQRQMQEEKLRKAIEAQQQLEREEAEKKAREEAEKIARLKEEEEKRKAAEEAEKIRKEEAEREEKERIARKQRVEAIMARTRLRKTDDDKKPENKGSAQNTQNSNAAENAQAPTVPDGGNENNGNSETRNNGNVAMHTEDLLGLSQNEEPVQPQETVKVSSPESTNGNLHNNVTHMTANFIQNEIAAEQQKKDISKIEDGDFTTHNGHGNNHAHPLTVQNAI